MILELIAFETSVKLTIELGSLVRMKSLNIYTPYLAFTFVFFVIVALALFKTSTLAKLKLSVTITCE